MTIFRGPLKTKPNLYCPLCGGQNSCALAGSGNSDAECWCREAVISPAAIARVPEAQRNVACLCANCAAASLSVAPD